VRQLPGELSLWGQKLHIRSMATKAKRGHEKFGFNRRTGTVVYRGVKIEPPMAAGKRSPRARAIREVILEGVMSEHSRGKSR
jgi:hypothetical protein